jgi:hypothetical protein
LVPSSTQVLFHSSRGQLLVLHRDSLHLVLLQSLATLMVSQGTLRVLALRSSSFLLHHLILL